MKNILGIGNALVDIMTTLEEDALLQYLKLPKGSMTLVDRVFSDEVLEKTRHLERRLASGGSAANAIHGLSRLGVPSSFIGKVGHDNYGDFFKKDLEDSQIRPFLLRSDTESGRAIALVSPDSERTFATYLGAAIELSAEDLDPGVFRSHHLLHIEGYLVQNHALMLAALRLAKQQGMFVSLDMASFNVVEAHLDFLRTILKEYVDIVFANEEEAKVFTGREPEGAVESLSEFCHIAIVKVGRHGSLVCQGESTIKVEAFPAEVIDTTGAGDLYASGFIYGMVNNLTLEECGEMGSLLASKVIGVIGAKIQADGWEQIHQYIK